MATDLPSPSATIAPLGRNGQPVSAVRLLVTELWNTGEYTYSEIVDALAEKGVARRRQSIGRDLNRSRRYGEQVQAAADVRQRRRRGGLRSVTTLGPAAIDARCAVMRAARSSNHRPGQALMVNGLQIVLSDVEFTAWLADAVQGDTAIYHIGLLAEDRHVSPGCSTARQQRAVEVDRYASFVAGMQEAGRVHLVQQPIGPARYRYQAVARRRAA